MLYWPLIAFSRLSVMKQSCGGRDRRETKPFTRELLACQMRPVVHMQSVIQIQFKLILHCEENVN